MNTEVLICVTCRTKSDAPDGDRSGRALFDLVQEKVFVEDINFLVRPIECMSGCSNGCAVAFQAPGKQSYLFGKIPPTEDAVNQLIACATQYQDSSDGRLTWDARPELFKGCTLARLPALSKKSS
jgi:predicted metal-binding protein